MGAICGLSGAMYIGFRGAIDPNDGSNFVLAVVAAVIIGGTPLSGGHGTVVGAVIGMLNHPGDLERTDLVRHRRAMEHVLDRCGLRACRVSRPTGQVAAQPRARPRRR